MHAIWQVNILIYTAAVPTWSAGEVVTGSDVLVLSVTHHGVHPAQVSVITTARARSHAPATRH